MKEALLLGKIYWLTRRRLQSGLVKSAAVRFLLNLLLIDAGYLGLAWLQQRWPISFFSGDQPATTLFFLFYGMGGALALVSGGRRLFGDKELALPRMLPLTPTTLFTGLTLGVLVDNLPGAAFFGIPLAARMAANAGLQAAAAGLSACLMGFLFGTAAGLGLLVLSVRRLGSLFRSRLALTGPLVAGPLIIAKAAGDPAVSALACAALSALAALAYLAGLFRYPATISAYLGQAASNLRGVITYRNLRRILPFPAGSLRGLIAKDLLMLLRNPLTLVRIAAWFLSLLVFPLFRSWIAARGIPLDKTASVAIYVIATVALVFTLELSATPFSSESGRMRILLASPVKVEEILFAKTLATLALPATAATLGALTASYQAGLDVRDLFTALIYALPATVGAGTLLTGMTASSIDPEAFPGEAVESLLLEQIPTGRGMAALILGMVLLAAEAIGLAIYRPVPPFFPVAFVGLILAQIGAGWWLGRYGLRSLVAR